MGDQTVFARCHRKARNQTKANKAMQPMTALLRLAVIRESGEGQSWLILGVRQTRNPDAVPVVILDIWEHSHASPFVPDYLRRGEDGVIVAVIHFGQFIFVFPFHIGDGQPNMRSIERRSAVLLILIFNLHSHFELMVSPTPPMTFSFDKLKTLDVLSEIFI
jgi:hypothetical protein